MCTGSLFFYHARFFFVNETGYLMKQRILKYLAILLLAAFQQQAAAAGQEYSATTKESSPREGDRTSRIFVSEQGVRTEYEANDEQYAQIVNYSTGEVYLVNTSKRTFMRRSLGQGASPAQQPGADPCEGQAGLVCKALGEEKVHGRDAVKWSIRQKGNEEAGEMTVWLDRQRHVPLQQAMPDGGTMTRRLLGAETVNKRKAEKWEVTFAGPEGDKTVSYQWYDPELETNLRDEQPGVYVRELLDVRPGPQDARLFVVPRDFTEISTGQGGQSQR